MSYTNVLRLSTDVETVFGVDQAETWRDQPVLEGSYQARTPVAFLQDMTATQRLHHRNLPRLGSKFGAGFEAQFYLAGLSAGLSAGVAYSAPQTSFLEILRAAYGGVVGNSGSLVDDTSGGGASTTTSIPVTAGQGSRFIAGGAVMISGVARRVLAVASDRLTLDQALPSAPANGVVVWNAVTVYPDEAEVGGDGDSLTCRALGYDAQDQTIYRGCVPMLTALRTEIDGLIVADVNMMAAKWEPVTGESLTASYSVVDGGPLPPVAGRVWFHSRNSTVNFAIEAHRFAFNPGQVVQPSRNFGTATVPSVEGVQRFRMHRQGATLSLGLRQHARDDWEAIRDLYDDKEPFEILLQFGTQPRAGALNETGCVVLDMQAAAFTAVPQRVDEDNETGINLEFQAMEFVVGSGTNLQQAHQRIHLF